jgi:hypothetical protein
MYNYVVKQFYIYIVIHNSKHDTCLGFISEHYIAINLIKLPFIIKVTQNTPNERLTEMNFTADLKHCKMFVQLVVLCLSRNFHSITYISYTRDVTSYGGGSPVLTVTKQISLIYMI